MKVEVTIQAKLPIKNLAALKSAVRTVIDIERKRLPTELRLQQYTTNRGAAFSIPALEPYEKPGFNSVFQLDHHFWDLTAIASLVHLTGNSAYLSIQGEAKIQDPEEIIRFMTWLNYFGLADHFDYRRAMCVIDGVRHRILKTPPIKGAKAGYALTQWNLDTSLDGWLIRRAGDVLFNPERTVQSRRNAIMALLKKHPNGLTSGQICAALSVYDFLTIRRDLDRLTQIRHLTERDARITGLSYKNLGMHTFRKLYYN